MRISIEGSIASGKSTVLQHLSTQGWKVFQEPVQQWENLLALFYTNQQRYAFTMNSCALLSFTDIPSVDDKGASVVVERSPLSCIEVFSRMHKNESTLSEKEFHLLCELHESYGWVPDVIIYLQAPSACCHKRSRQRGRQSEQMVSYDYMSKLQVAHNNMLRWYEGEIHIVDASQDIATVANRVLDILQAYR